MPPNSSVQRTGRDPVRQEGYPVSICHREDLMRALILGIVLAVMPLAGHGEDSKRLADAYICIPDLATGFRYDEKAHQWVISSFKVRGEKYLFKKDASGLWKWSEFGTTTQPVECEDNAYARERIWIRCHSHFHTAIFSFRALRFQHVTLGGYVHGHAPSDANKPDTPYIEIGTCTPL